MLLGPAQLITHFFYYYSHLYTESHGSKLFPVAQLYFSCISFLVHPTLWYLLQVERLLQIYWQTHNYVDGYLRPPIIHVFHPNPERICVYRSCSRTHFHFSLWVSLYSIIASLFLIRSESIPGYDHNPSFFCIYSKISRMWRTNPWINSSVLLMLSLRSYIICLYQQLKVI